LARGGRAAAEVAEGIIAKAAKKVMPEVAEDAVRAGAREGAQAAAREGAQAAGREGAQTAAREGAQAAARTGARETAESGAETTTRAAARTATRDPIDVASGEVLLHEVDVRLPGVLPLVLDRTHVSSYRTGRWFGLTWSSTLDQRLEVDAAGSCLVSTEGMVLTYPVPMFGESALPDRGPRWPLVSGADGYTVTDPQAGRTLHFAPQPNAAPPGGRAMVLPLAAITDRSGHRIDLIYDSEGALTEVRHSGGYRIGVETAGGRITGLRLLTAGARGDGDGPPVLAQYGYDDGGRLVEMTGSSGQVTRYEYDRAGRLTRWVDATGGWYAYTYDEQGRCVRGDGPDGRLRTTLDYRDQVTVVTDSLGNQTTYQLDERGKIVSETNPLGATTWSAWDYHGQLLSRTDPLGRATRYSYDEHGNLTAVIRPDGARGSVVYNDLDLPVELTEPGGAGWRQAYDERGNLTSVTDPTGAVTTYGYDHRGCLTAVTDPLGGVTRVDANAAGLPVAVTDPLENTTRHIRDAFGRIVSTADPLGGVNRFGWTIEGKPEWAVRPDGVTERWTYDAEGNLLSYVDPAGQTVRMEISYFGVPATMTWPGGERIQFAYDTEMRLVSVTNPQGLVWRYEYDAAGNLANEIDFNGRVTSCGYDAAGQLVRCTNGAGETNQYRYDALGNVVEKRSGETVTTFAYDAASRLVHALNADADLRFQRNPRGQVIAEICNGRVLASMYDPLGRRTRRRTPSGAEAVWHFDPASRPVVLETAGQTLRFAYDAAGREVRRHIGAGAVLDQHWDAHHRLAGQSLWGAPRPATIGPRNVQARMVQHRAYSYAPDGNLIGLDDQVLGTSRFDLDTAGRVTGVRASGWTERYAYDSAGNITYAEWPTSPHQPSDEDAAGPREYSGTLITRAGNVRYEYDAQGRVAIRQHKRLSSKPLTWRYFWDADDRLTGVVTPDGRQWRYRYDPLGRRIAKQRLTPEGRYVVEQVDFAWDEFVLAEQTHTVWRPSAPPQTRTITWEHEPGGFRPVTQTERAPLPDAPQQWIDERFYAIVTDLVGSPAELVDADGNVGWHFRATLWGAPQAEWTGGAYCPLRFPGQYFDAETGLHYNFHRYYDPAAGRYQSSDPVGLTAGPNNYSYVQNPLNTFDLLGLGGCKITVYRKQTGHPQSQRLSVDANGNVTLQGRGKLYVNMSDEISHSRNFRRGEGEIVAFDVPASFRDYVRDIAVPQRNPGDFSPAEWKEMLRISPEISDPTKSADLYGIPSSMFGELRDAIIPGSGRVLPG
jgi:RHS repeat-associated protein